MGFLESSRQRMRLARMRKELEADPRPHGLAELARAYLAIDDRANASQIVAFAERMFPDSEAVRRVRAVLRGHDLDLRLQAAKDAMRDRPSVASWLELADAYRALGREEQYGAILREALEHFQHDGNVLMQLAELRYRRFLESLATPDGKAAIDLFERALAADRENLKARYLLAEITWRIGGTGFARAHLATLLEIAPEHERGRKLLDTIEAKGGVDTSREDLISLFANVEERMELPNRRLPWDGPDSMAAQNAAAVDPSPELDRLALATDATQIVYFDPAEGMHAKGCEPELAECVKRIHDACQRAARGMELGTPSGFTIDTASGALVIEMKRGSSLGLLVPSERSIDRASIAARDALERLTRGA